MNLLKKLFKKKEKALQQGAVMPRLEWRNIEDGLPPSKADDPIRSEEVMIEAHKDWDNELFYEPAYVYGHKDSPLRHFLTKYGFEYCAGVKILRWAYIPPNEA